MRCVNRVRRERRLSAHLTPYEFFSRVVKKSPENAPGQMQRQEVCAEIQAAFVGSRLKIHRVFASQSRSAATKTARLSLRHSDFQTQQNKFEDRPAPRRRSRSCLPSG